MIRKSSRLAPPDPLDLLLAELKSAISQNNPRAVLRLLKGFQHVTEVVNHINIETDHETAIYHALKNGHVDESIVFTLLFYLADPSISTLLQRIYPVFQAASQQWSKAVILSVLAHGARIELIGELNSVRSILHQKKIIFIHRKYLFDLKVW